MLGSAHGRGSRKSSQPYLSGPYGPGSHHHHGHHRSLAKNYASIHSHRTGDAEFSAYGAAGAAHMLTTIDATRQAEKSDGGSKSSSGRNSPVRESMEKMIRSPSRTYSQAYNGGPGRIAVTTEVDVRESIGAREVCEDGSRQQRRERGGLV